MLLAIDIGNSNVHIGFFKNNKLVHNFDIGIGANRSVDEYALTIKLLTVNGNCKMSDVEGVIIGSVVPSVTGKIQKAIAKLTKAPVTIVGPGIKTGFSIKVDDPSQLGADIVANTAGAIDKVRYPVIIVDLGTATTVSAVDKNKAYVGCYIMPGIQMGLDALHSTELLPEVFADKAVPILGKNSIDSMRAGVTFGTIMACEGFIDAYKKELDLPSDTTIVVTGGYSEDLLSYFAKKVTYIPNLTLNGLNVIYNTNKKR